MCPQAPFKSITYLKYKRAPGIPLRHSTTTRKVNSVTLLFYRFWFSPKSESSAYSFRGVTLCAYKCQEENCVAFRVTGHNRCQFGSLQKSSVYAKEGIVVYSKGQYLNDVYTWRGQRVPQMRM